MIEAYQVLDWIIHLIVALSFQNSHCKSFSKNNREIIWKISCVH